MTREIEFRLAASPDTLDEIAGFLFPNGNASRGLRAQKLHAIYYDTVDQRLRQRGLALRVRKNGRKFTQTLKTDSTNAAVFDRREWEVEVPGFTPDFRAFDDPEIADRIGLIFPEELQPLFETDIRRRVGLFDVANPDRTPARIELAFDVGVIKTEQQTANVSELELELKAGDTRSLFELAAMIRERTPLRLLTLDKATRGYRLAINEAPSWAKAEKLKLVGDMTAEEGLEAVLTAGLNHWLQNEQAAFAGNDPEGVHQLRVALRRLRSALTLFRTVLVGEARISWNDRLREILNAMGPARDLDVFEEEMLSPVLATRAEDEGLIALNDVAAKERAKAQEKVREAINSQAYADTILDLIWWLERKGWREGAEVDLLIAQRMPLLQLASSTLDKGHKSVRKKGKHF
ncbi:MAG: CHAD domain-containing protein, partial [Pseudomonadota bacterium]